MRVPLTAPHSSLSWFCIPMSSFSNSPSSQYCPFHYEHLSNWPPLLKITALAVQDFPCYVTRARWMFFLFFSHLRPYDEELFCIASPFQRDGWSSQCGHPPQEICTRRKWRLEKAQPLDRSAKATNWNTQNPTFRNSQAPFPCHDCNTFQPGHKQKLRIPKPPSWADWPFISPPCWMFLFALVYVVPSYLPHTRRVRADFTSQHKQSFLIKWAQYWNQ